MKRIDSWSQSLPPLSGVAQVPQAAQAPWTAPRAKRRVSNAWRTGRRRIDYQPTAGALAAIEAYLPSGLQIRTIIDSLIIEGANAVAKRRAAATEEV